MGGGGRWLEDPDSAETKAFVDAQNAVTEHVMAQCGTQEKFRALMQQLYDYPRYSTPSRHGNRWAAKHKRRPAQRAQTRYVSVAVFCVPSGVSRRHARHAAELCALITSLL